MTRNEARCFEARSFDMESWRVALWLWDSDGQHSSEFCNSGRPFERIWIIVLLFNNMAIDPTSAPLFIFSI